MAILRCALRLPNFAFRNCQQIDLLPVEKIAQNFEAWLLCVATAYTMSVSSITIQAIFEQNQAHGQALIELSTNIDIDFADFEPSLVKIAILKIETKH
jgi:hypothetical protein